MCFDLTPLTHLTQSKKTIFLIVAQKLANVIIQYKKELLC